MTESSGYKAFKVMNGTHYVQIEFQGQWVSQNTTINLIDYSQTSNRTVNINCWVYSLTVYVQTTADSPNPNIPITGVSLTLFRTSDNTTLNGLYDLPNSFLTQSYNSTHARYLWTQLANQTSSYTITGDITGSAGAKSVTVPLSADTETEIELVYPVGGSGGGGSGGGPSFPTPSPITPLPTLPEVQPLPIGTILQKNMIPIVIIGGMAMVFAIPFMGREKKTGVKRYSESYQIKYKPKKKKKEKENKFKKR
jgi:hypothetical protein